MTAASHRNARFVALARRYARRRLARELDGLWAAGLEGARRVAERGPVIFAANHVAWWDAFVLVTLDRELRTEGHALMEAGNLRALPFFGWLGAVPVDPARPMPGLRAAARLAEHPGQALWIFPQGSQRPAHLRPLGFRGGVRVLGRLASRAAVVPVALQYAFRQSPRPAAYVSFGAPLAAGRVAAPEGVDHLEQAVCRELRRVDAHLQGEEAGFSAVVPPRGGDPTGGIGAGLLRRMARVSRA